jgi:hypothetical protein
LIRLVHARSLNTMCIAILVFYEQEAAAAVAAEVS